MRTDLRREIEAEVRAEMEAKANPSVKTETTRIEAMAGSLEAWLAAHVGRTSFGLKATYAKSAARPAPSTPPIEKKAAATRTARATTVEQLCAVELLSRHSTLRLENEFTDAQLKQVWRRAALKSHPDRFTSEESLVQLQKAALFRELASAYETLEHLFEKQDVAA